MINLLNRIVRRINIKFKKDPKWRPKINMVNNILDLGSVGCSWSIPDHCLDSNSICYLAGAGEDISFDVSLVEKYKLTAHIFDPTPRAKNHFDLLTKSASRNEFFPINNSPTEKYSLRKEDIDLLIFHEYGLWDKQDSIKFFAPKNPEHVSHSAVNLQKTETFFIAKVERLKNIMSQLNHTNIDLLKIDIEGAEYRVIDSIIEDKIPIKILCIEFDEAYNPIDENWENRIKEKVELLLSSGFVIIAGDNFHNYTFIDYNTYSKLSKST